VPLEEASRFGILSVNEDGQIYKFSEKPKNPDSTKASMGIYVFSKKKLFDYLIADEKDEKSSNDFGKNIIPAMLAAKERMFAYPFAGYWKDVGTISSLWEANMDLLGDDPALVLNDESWRIFSRHEPNAPQYIGAEAVVQNSSVTAGCDIYGTVKNSVLGSGVKVMKGAVVCDSVIFDNCVIEEGAQINYSMLDSGVVIGKNTTVGVDKNTAKGVTVIGSGIKIADNSCIADDQMISEVKEG
ncbi:MAG: glucose-1-phosphate adenylyltransferase, partial [Clostridia bacterium]|nr:glucose-1-phosphate adenylyltransferase [Clostridia bacterium]